MRTTDLLDTVLSSRCQSMHVKWFALLKNAVNAVTEADALTLTALGRALGEGHGEKHSIKRADRLQGNAHMYRELPLLYSALGCWLPGLEQSSVILVDWSTLNKGES